MGATWSDPTSIFVTVLALLVLGRMIAPWCGVRPVAVRQGPLYRSSDRIAAGRRLTGVERDALDLMLCRVLPSTC